MDEKGLGRDGMNETKAGLLTLKEAAAMAAVSVDWLAREGRTSRAAWYRRLGHRTVRIEPAGFLQYLTGKRGR